ncbi:MAG: peptidoglycan DD-metalloendopeptidase family protein [Bacillota bacterium]
MNRKKLIVSYVLVMLLSVVGVANAVDRTLQNGMKGKDVRELQENLVMLGEPVMIDGIFGSSTKQAVAKFQRKAGLPADGVVGNQTWDELKQSVSFDEYDVRQGDTLYEIARDFDIPVKAIRNANDLDNNVIQPGQEIIIPKTGMGGGLDTDFYNVISYRVKSGDTLEKLAQKYHTTVRRIKDVNDLSTNHLKAGQKIKVPKLMLDLSGSSRGSGQVDNNEFIWPVEGKISSNYGQRTHPILNEKKFHGGIDIAVPSGTPIKAVKSGKVLTSGRVKGFGKTVTIDHGDGVVTSYAHNSETLVNSGDNVKQGEEICRSGNTGLSTGPHLDFRILINDKPVNPIEYLE